MTAGTAVPVLFRSGTRHAGSNLSLVQHRRTPVGNRDTDLIGQTAVDLAELVRSGKVTPTEVVGAHLERIRSFNPQLGAFERVRTEKALAEAEEVGARPDLADLPLAGLPLAIKDEIPVAGEPLRYGSAATTDTPQAEDHELVKRVRAAGAVVVGASRMPELGIWAAGDNRFGMAKNPWNLERVAGGSSSGAAAAVAFGMLPFNHAADGLGSIRIPAACCGLFGLKPGLGVVPADIGPDSWKHMTENGPLATTVDDAALLFSVMAGREEFRNPRPPEGSLRIAISVKNPLVGSPVDKQHKAAVFETGRLLEAAGHKVRNADPSYPIKLGPIVTSWWVGIVYEEVIGLRLDPKKLEPRNRRHAALGRMAIRLGRVKEKDRTEWQGHIGAFLDDYDVLITPTTALPPLKAKLWSRRGWLANYVANVRYAPFPAGANFAQIPSAAVPAGVHTLGTPLSVMLTARPGSEAVLFSVAKQLEGLRPWKRYAPMAGLG
jgi:amidase